MAAPPAPLPAAIAGWWEYVNGSPAWQDGIFDALAVLHGLVAASLFGLLWLGLWYNPNHTMLVVSKLFIAGLSLFAALGFLLYDGRLFLMLKPFSN